MKLKRCPFCGQMPLVGPEDALSVSVQCHHCGARSAQVVLPSDNPREQTMEELRTEMLTKAIAAWNKRPQPLIGIIYRELGLTNRLLWEVYDVRPDEANIHLNQVWISLRRVNQAGQRLRQFNTKLVGVRQQDYEASYIPWFEMV